MSAAMETAFGYCTSDMKLSYEALRQMTDPYGTHLFIDRGTVDKATCCRRWYTLQDSFHCSGIWMGKRNGSKGWGKEYSYLVQARIKQGTVFE